MNIPHQLGKEEARTRIQSLLQQVQSRYGAQVQDLNEEWNGDTGTFSFKVMNMAVSGTLTVNDNEVALNSKLPLAASMFQGQIKNVIMEEAKKVLS